MKPIQNPAILPPEGSLRVVAGQPVVDLRGIGVSENGDLTVSGNLTVEGTAPFVRKSDVQVFPLPGRVDLVGGNAWQIRFRMGFVGTFTRISSVMSGVTLNASAVGTLLIAGGAVTGGVVTHANAAAAGDAQDQAITAGGAFTADQEVRYTISGTNSSAAFAGVVLEYTRS